MSGLGHALHGRLPARTCGQLSWGCLLSVPSFIDFGSSGCLGFGCLCGLTAVGITIVPLLRISLAPLMLFIDERPRRWQIPCAAMHCVRRNCLSDVCRVSRISVPTLSGLRASGLQAHGVARTRKFVCRCSVDTCSFGIRVEGSHSAHVCVCVHILTDPNDTRLPVCIITGSLPETMRWLSFMTCYLVDPASSHMLVSKIKPCMCKYELIQTVKLRMAH